MLGMLIAGILISLSGPTVPPEDFRPVQTLVGTLLSTLAGALSGLAYRWGIPQRAPATLAEQLAWRRRHHLSTWLGRGLLVGTYLFTVHGLSWPAFVSTTLALRKVVAVDQVLILAPYLVSMLGAMVISFPAQRRATGIPWSLGAYLGFVLRQYWALLLLPWLLYVMMLDLLEMFVTPRLPAQWRAPIGWTSLLALMVLLYTFWPLTLRWFWPTRELPEGPLRDRLTALCRRAGVGYRKMLIWRAPAGGLANAAVAGLTTGVRHILLTDTLLEQLEPEEVEAVLGHELGHVLRHHLPAYVLFAMGFIGLALLADILLLGGSLPEPTLTVGPGANLLDLAVSATVIGLYWGVLFGWLSRRFEREADLAGSELVANPEALAQALEKITQLNGRPRTRASWRDFSVANRSEFLRRTALDPALRARAFAQCRALRLILAIGAGIAVAAVGCLLFLSHA
jgi:Zn-dependent protease with chaperone function